VVEPCNNAPLRRQPGPTHRLGIVLRDAASEAVHDPEIELRAGVSLIRRQPKPAHRLGVILRHTPALAVRGPEVVLPLGRSLLCR
jgi:hypothetical protein